MPNRNLVALAATLAVSAAAPAVADAAMKLKRVTQPPSAAQPGDEVRMKVRLVNRGNTVERGKLKMTLTGPRQSYTVPNRIIRRNVRMAPRSFKRFRVGFSVPLASTPGVYRVRTCLKAAGVPGQRCRVSRAMKVS